MKLCKDCEHVKTDTMQDPRSGQFMTQFYCGHGECVDPVSGEPIPAGFARKDPLFCGFPARFYRKREEKPVTPVIQLVQS